MEDITSSGIDRIRHAVADLVVLLVSALPEKSGQNKAAASHLLRTAGTAVPPVHDSGVDALIRRVCEIVDTQHIEVTNKSLRHRISAAAGRPHSTHKLNVLQLAEHKLASVIPAEDIFSVWLCLHRVQHSCKQRACMR
jgi:hypothetical protein